MRRAIRYVRLLSGIVALLDFIVTGTFFRFVATSWRYALFFLYPIVLIAIILALSYGIGSAATAIVHRKRTDRPADPFVPLRRRVVLVCGQQNALLAHYG